MKDKYVLFLRITLILIAIPVLVLCVFWVPMMMGYLPNIVVIILYLTALLYFYALFNASNILTRIDKKDVFSNISLNSLTKIKNCAIGISALYVIALPFLYPIAEVDDAPGLLGFPLLIIFASIVISVFAAVLEKLLAEAIKLKNENDLTVWGGVMAIIVNLDVMLAKRKMSVTELSEKVGITMANISILKNGKAKAIRFQTLNAICEALDCQPGDILEYRRDWLNLNSKNIHRYNR